jgi:DMSO reductase anchor subunit
MNPAFSVVVFTVVAGAAQGLVVALAIAFLAGFHIAPGFATLGLVIAAVMLVVGLGSSFLHLGRPERAWRAASMWRTSWLSREVLALPGFIGVVALWWLAAVAGASAIWLATLLPALALVTATLLWLCTAMVYACLRFIEEWAHPLTFVNFVLIGLSSGFLLFAALAASSGDVEVVKSLGPAALLLTVAAGAGRALALQRNAGLRHRSTLQSATGIRAPRLVQTSMGMSAGSFNTREFFHRASQAALRRIRLALFVLGFALPALLALLAIATGSIVAWWLAVLVQLPGLLADRWLFFAQAKHPQNLYYQVVS